MLFSEENSLDRIGVSMKRAFDSLMDLLWGDSSGLMSVIRGAIKWAAALVVALALHEFLLLWVLQPGSSWDELQASFRGSNERLAAEKVKLKAEPTKGPPAITICLYGSWKIQKDLQCPSLPEPTIFGLGYLVLRDGQVTTPEPRRFFFAHGFPSEIVIEASLEMLLRDVERSALNVPGTSDVSLMLCAGTRELANEDGCKVMARIREGLSSRIGSLDVQIDRIRIRALFFGPFHYLTLAVFVFAMIESLGLYVRWVRPSPTLYEVKEGALQLNSTSNDVVTFSKTLVQSLGDQLFYQALLASPRAELEKGRSRDADQKSHDTDVTVLSGDVIGSIESYRNHMVDDAASRQEPLETLGDTMLKLAFMGTVYGISAALFAARQLDTADPVEKLLAKAEMYSGIGVGFGTTLTGIILSIIAAQVRSIVSGAWSYQVGRAYELIMSYGPASFIDLSNRFGTDLDQVRNVSASVSSSDYSNTKVALWFLLILLVAYLSWHVVANYIL